LRQIVPTEGEVMPDAEEGYGAKVGRESDKSADRKESTASQLLSQALSAHLSHRYRV